MVAAPVPDKREELDRRPPCFGIRVSSYKDGLVYTVGKEAPDIPGSVRLWQATLGPEKDEPQVTSRTFRNWAYSWPLYFFRWRVAYGVVWAYGGPVLDGAGRSHYIPWEDLNLVDTKNADGDAKLRKKYGFSPDPGVTVDWGRANLALPAEEAALDVRMQHAEEPEEGAVQADFLPISTRGILLFVLRDSKVTVWRGENKSKSGGIYTTFEFTQSAAAVDTPFQEPFLAYGTADAPCFVTKSGKVYRLSLPAKGEPKVASVWDDEKRPVREILTDADAGRTFLAGPDLGDGRQGRGFYFELAEKPKPLPFDRTALDPVKAEEPLKSSLEFARFLVKEGKLKSDPKDK
jgi:hypothetical protein